MVILSFVVAGMFSVFISAQKFTLQSGQRTIAINFAQEIMEELKSLNYADSALDVGGPYSRPLPAGRLSGGDRFYVVDNYPPQGKKVTVAVQWDEIVVNATTETRTEQLATLIANPGP